MKTYIFFLIALQFSALPAIARGTSGYVTTQFSADDFKLVQGDSIADVLVGSEENVAVWRCARDLADDIQRITGKKPALKNSTTALTKYTLSLEPSIKAWSSKP